MVVQILVQRADKLCTYFIMIASDADANEISIDRDKHFTYFTYKEPIPTYINFTNGYTYILEK